MGARTLIALALLAACAGPAPAIERATVSPSPRPGCTRVEVEVANHGGAGEIELDFRLRDLRTDAEVHATRHVDVGRGGHVVYTTDIETPPGDYAADVSAAYPD